MNYIPELKFKEIAEDTNEKEKKQKLADQARWKKFFSLHVIGYFDDHSFRSFHKEFNPMKDKLDCFIPSRGKFKCGERGKPSVAGKRKRKKKKKSAVVLKKEEKSEEGNLENGEKFLEGNSAVLEKEEKSEEGNLENGEKLLEGNSENGEKSQDVGCGHNWSSNKCLTKLVCSIEERKKLVVEVREYGQRCERCKQRYENASFIDHNLDIMIEWSLTMILEGMFGVVDHNIDVDPNDMGYFHRRRTNRSKQTNHESAICQACIENKDCGIKRKRRKPKKKKKQGQSTSPQSQTQPQSLVAMSSA